MLIIELCRYFLTTSLKYRLISNLVLFQMVKRTPGSGVYLYQHDIDYVQRVRDPSAQGKAAYNKRIAKILMNIFFNKIDCPDCQLSPKAKDHLVLDETITSAIIIKFSCIVLLDVSCHYGFRCY